MPCLFCGEAKLTKEHLFPAWLIDRLPEEERTRKIEHEMFVGQESTARFTGLPFQQSVRVVCGECNNGWMSEIESGVQPVLDSILGGESGFVIDTDDQWKLAEWAYLRCLVFVATQDKANHHMKDRCESFYSSRQPSPAIFRDGAAEEPSLSGFMTAYVIPFHGDLTGHVSLFVFYDETTKDVVLSTLFLKSGWPCMLEVSSNQQQGDTRMEVHANAKLTPQGRLTMVRRLENENWTLARAAAAAGVSVKTASKWRARYRAEADAGLIDRSSRPKRIPHQTPEDRVEAIAALRRIRSTGAEIAEMLEMPVSTVSLVLRRIGLGKLSRLEPPEPPNRYEKQRPGELIHIDIKKLARIGKNGPGHRVQGRGRGRRSAGAGWECVRVCVDDATRLAYVEVLPDEKAVTAIGFLRRAIKHYASFGIKVERLMTDNGSAYVSFAHAAACRALAIKHIRTRPYRPRTNGKAERFIRTMLGGWAYGAIYGSSAERTAALSGWLDFYNWKRPHGSLAKRPPGTRLAELNRNKVVGSYN